MKEIADVLRELAAQLGTTVEALWPSMLGKVVVDWWAGLFTCLSILAILLWIVRYTVRKVAEGDEFEEFWGGATVFFGVLGLAVLGITAIQIGHIGNIFYPEVAAVEKILSLLG